MDVREPVGHLREVRTRQASSAPGTRSSQRPVLTFWSIAVALEVLLGVAFLLTGADAAIDTGLDKAGLDFSSDLVTAARVVVAYPAAVVGVLLALAQVAAPDLAVFVVARIGDGRELLRAVGSRLRPWSREVGARRGIGIWVTVVVVFSACNLASGVLHRELVPHDFTWHFSWSMVALLPVAMFLDAGALLEENGWRGFALPALLRTRGPVAASLVVGLAWASWHFPVKYDAFVDYGWWGGSAYLGAFTVKIVAISVVITFFWARAGQATLLAVAMHGLSNDVARVGGLVDGSTWQSSAISELDLAAPFILLALVLVPYANRTGWGDLTALGDDPGVVQARAELSRRHGRAAARIRGLLDPQPPRAAPRLRPGVRFETTDLAVHPRGGSTGALLVTNASSHSPGAAPDRPGRRLQTGCSMSDRDVARPRRRHLLSAETLARAARTRSGVDLTRAHGQGNGLRVHGIYFAVVSLVGLVLVIVGVAVASSMM